MNELYELQHVRSTRSSKAKVNNRCITLISPLITRLEGGSKKWGLPGPWQFGR
jgi:hypothetical protein